MLIENKSMIPCLRWIPKGYARASPITNADLDMQMREMMGDEELMKKVRESQKNMQAEEDEDNCVMPVFAKEADIKNQIDSKGMPFGFDDNKEEKDDYTIRKSDCLLMAGKIEDEYSNLEIYVYEENKVNLYVHHDIMLSSFPICLEWLPIEPSSFANAECDRANLGIVGSFLPDIEIWDLDILDSVEPKLVLEGVNSQPLRRKKKKNKKKGGHSDAVIALALNSVQKNILCSGSADSTVKIWDLQTAKPVVTHNCNNQKPEVVKWHPEEQSWLLVATDDYTLKAVDIRDKKEIGSFKFESSIESMNFDNINSSEVHLSFDNGYIGAVDLRKGMSASYGLKVSKKAVSSVSMSFGIPGLLVTTCLDGVMTAFNTKERSENNCPTLVERRLTKGGQLFSGSFYEDSKTLFGCGSSSGEVILWAMDGEKKVREVFGVQENPIES